MKHRGHRGWRRHEHDDLNRGDYRGDFGPEGHARFASSPDHDHREHHEGHYGRHRHHDERESMLDPDDHRHERTAGPWRWDHLGREGWQRGRVSGGYGSQFDAWRSGVSSRAAGFGFGPHEDPGRGGFEDQDWQPTRPARGRGAWAGDWSEASHRGRGPKGYRRSDERIREELCERLSDDPRVDASEVTVNVKDGEVTFTGAVPTRDQKRFASEIGEGVSGVHDVFNQLRVTQSSDFARRTEREGHGR